jgi:acyl carrier protein
MESIPCFNVTKEESRISTDADVNVTLTSSGSENLTLDSLSASEVASYVADAADVDNGKTAAYLRAAMQELW